MQSSDHPTTKHEECWQFIKFWEVYSNNFQAIKTKDTCKFKLVPNTNYAISVITIEGLKNRDKSNIFVEVHPLRIKANIEVTDKEPPTKGDDLDIKIVNSDLGQDERAQ